MATLMKYYKFSIMFAIMAVIGGFLIWGLETAIVIAALATLEISLSFDNAVVNARVLTGWDEKWRKRFLVWGILIAVFGMRIIFPLAIVTITTGIGPIAVTAMAFNEPTLYAKHLTSVHHQVAGFGGAFLFMVAFGFFLEEKMTYWWEAMEKRLTKFGQMEGIAAAFVLGFMAIFAKFFPDPAHGTEFFVAGVWGVITFIIAHGAGTLLGGSEGEGGSGTVIKAGVMGFLYLELLDSTFSGDGVIAAFVLSNYLPVIALGLAIGAFFVRSMTIHLVEVGTLAEYRFLEHGAFYAILALASIMFGSGIGYELPEWLTGTLSAFILGAALLHSYVLNHKEERV